MTEWDEQWRVKRQETEQAHRDYVQNLESINLHRQAQIKEPSATRYIAESVKLQLFGFAVLIASATVLNLLPEDMLRYLLFLPLSFAVGLLIFIYWGLGIDLEQYYKDRESKRNPKTKPQTVINNRTIIQAVPEQPTEPAEDESDEATYFYRLERFIAWCYEYQRSHDGKMPSEREAQAEKQFDKMPTDKWLSDMADNGVSEGRTSTGFKSSGRWCEGLTLHSAFVAMGYEVEEPSKPSKTATEMLSNAANDQ